MPSISVVNHSSVMTDKQVSNLLPALTHQSQADFAPFWGRSAYLTFDGQTPKPGEWTMGIFDDADQAGALGYHDVTKQGMPLAKVFAKTTLEDDQLVSVTMSHELLEMLADPFINLTVGASHGAWAVEVCDPVEADQFGYKIGDVQVSNFILPSWFPSSGSGPYDFRSQLKAPLIIAAGGYMGYLTYSTNRWRQLGPSLNASPVIPPPGSRRERRVRGSEHWKVSVNAAE